MRKLSLFTLLLFAVLFVACDAPDSAAEEAMEETMEEVEDSPAATLDATVAAVQSAGGDLTALPAGAAVENIDTWIEQLDDVDGADGIVNSLGELKSALGQSDINGPMVGVILSSLANQTRSVAGSTPGISGLASALEAGAGKLTASVGGGTSLLDQTLQAVLANGASVTSLPADAAVANIDAWTAEVAKLDGSDDLVEGLNELKMALTAPSIDGSQVAGILANLASETRDVAGDNKALATLAYALDAGAYNLRNR